MAIFDYFAETICARADPNTAVQYASKEYLEILLELVKLTKTQPELVSAIGLCNFDTEHTLEICQYMLERTGEVGIVSNQVQFSLLDSRPLQKMSAVCDKYGIKLLTYGSFVRTARAILGTRGRS